MQDKAKNLVNQLPGCPKACSKQQAALFYKTNCGFEYLLDQRGEQVCGVFYLLRSEMLRKPGICTTLRVWCRRFTQVGLSTQKRQVRAPEHVLISEKGH